MSRWDRHPDPEVRALAQRADAAERETEKRNAALERAVARADTAERERDAARAALDPARDLYERAMNAIHEAAGIRRDGIAGIIAWIDGTRAERDAAQAALADVSRRCGGYRDSRVDGDGGIVAVVVRERDDLAEDARLWREQQAEIERDLADADATIAMNDAVRALPEAERRAAVLAGAGDVWTDAEHQRLRDTAATMPVFVRVCQEKRDALRERDEAQETLARVRATRDACLATAEEATRQTEEAIRQRDEAQAALVGLRQAAELFALAVHGGRPKYSEGRALKAALATTPAALAGQVRARVLREAAGLLRPGEGHGEHMGWRCSEDARDWLRALADEAER